MLSVSVTYVIVTVKFMAIPLRNYLTISLDGGDDRYSNVTVVVIVTFIVLIMSTCL